MAIFSSDVEPRADIDIVLKRGDKVIGISQGATASELLQSDEGLPAGEYTLLVVALGLKAERATVYVHTWLFPSSDIAGSGAMQVSPSSVVTRPDDESCCPVILSFSNLDFTSTLPGR